MKRCRITVEIEEADKQKIETTIKREYPKLKSISDVIREALKKFFLEN
jgi:Arc/MetJ-type ribon-helix-helix transcriptional regulator